MRAFLLLPLLLLPLSLAPLAQGAEDVAREKHTVDLPFIRNTGSAFVFAPLDTPKHFNDIHKLIREKLMSRTINCFRLSKWTFGKVDCFEKVFKQPLFVPKSAENIPSHLAGIPSTLRFSMEYMYAMKIMEPISRKDSAGKARLKVAIVVEKFLIELQKNFYTKCNHIRDVDLAPCDEIASDPKRIYKSAHRLYEAANTTWEPM